MFSCKFTAYFRNTFFEEHLWMAAFKLSKEVNPCCWAYSSPCNLTPPVSRVLIGRHLIFCPPTWPMCCNSPRKCTPVKYKARQKAEFPIVNYKTYEKIQKPYYKGLGNCGSYTNTDISAYLFFLHVEDGKVSRKVASTQYRPSPSSGEGLTIAVLLKFPCENLLSIAKMRKKIMKNFIMTKW